MTIIKERMKQLLDKKSSSAEMLPFVNFSGEAKVEIVLKIFTFFIVHLVDVPYLLD